MYRFLLSPDDAGAVGGAAATPAADKAAATPPADLKPVVPPVAQAAAPAQAAPAQAATPAAPFDMKAFMSELKAQQAEQDARTAMLIRTSLIEAGVVKQAPARGPGRPATKAPDSAAQAAATQAAATEAARATAAAGNANQGAAAEGADTLENQALRTKLAEMEAAQAEIKAALAIAEKEKIESANLAHQAKVRASVEKILTSSSIGMSGDSATQAAEVVLDLKKYVVEDAQGNLFVKFKDDSGAEVTKPLLEGLQAWSNTRAGKVFKPPMPAGSGTNQRIAERYAAVGKTMPVAKLNNDSATFGNAWAQQKAGQTTR